MTAETVDRQGHIFQQMYELLGSEIVAVHVKDFIIKNGSRHMVPLGTGIVKLPGVLQWLKANQPEIPVLRENSMRESDYADIAYIKQGRI